MRVVDPARKRGKPQSPEGGTEQRRAKVLSGERPIAFGTLIDLDSWAGLGWISMSESEKAKVDFSGIDCTSEQPLCCHHMGRLVCLSG